MLFSSNIFLFYFLPAVLAACVLTPRRFKNILLLLASVVFYFYGSGHYILLLAFMVVANYTLGERILTASQGAPRKRLLLLGCALNVIILVYYKYLAFFARQVDTLFGLGLDLTRFQVEFPLGISFCTFIAMSYLIEMYSGKIRSRVHLVDFGMFMSFFPHLIAGPIIRFTDIEDDINAHTLTVDMFYRGVLRFCLGIGKKVLLANNVGFVADKIFSAKEGLPSCELAWLGMVCYALQIYYDFSGYSDMAIGLGNMFGFHFPENFNQPYRASSVTDFWRRWHMTLSKWLRDFLYIPLGGNRRGEARTYLNLVLVFLVCGLWHGAAWTFVIWGLYHGLFLMAERLLANRLGRTISGPLGTVYTFLAVAVGWVFFRSASIGAAWGYIQSLVAFSDFSVRHLLEAKLTLGLSTENFVALAAAAFFAFFPFRPDFLAPTTHVARRLALSLGCLGILLLSVLSLSVSGYNPFIYSNF